MVLPQHRAAHTWPEARVIAALCPEKRTAKLTIGIDGLTKHFMQVQLLPLPRGKPQRYHVVSIGMSNT